MFIEYGIEHIDSDEDWKKSEVQFRNWLQQKDFPFVRISQLNESEYSGKLNDENTGRPDFFVLIDGIGTIAVDVKLRTVYSDDAFYITERERRRLLNFENSFHMNVWGCFIHRQDPYHDADVFYMCRIVDFSKDGLDTRPVNKKNKPEERGVFITKEQMVAIPADATGSFRDLFPG